MIPETVGALLAFLGLIAPGVAFELLRERRRPALEETAFREASRIALSSLIFTTGSLAVLAIVRTIRPAAVLDPAAWINRGKDYVSGHIGLVSRTLLIELAIALLLAVLADWLFRRSAPGRIAPGSMWYQQFRQRRPAGTRPWLHIRLDDETEVWGYLGDYSADQKLENRELTVRGPRLQYRRKGETTNEMLNSWSSVLLRGEAIAWMKVAYVADESPADEPRLVPAADPGRGRVRRRRRQAFRRRRSRPGR